MLSCWPPFESQTVFLGWLEQSMYWRALQKTLSTRVTVVPPTIDPGVVCLGSEQAPLWTLWISLFLQWSTAREHLAARKQYLKFSNEILADVIFWTVFFAASWFSRRLYCIACQTSIYLHFFYKAIKPVDFEPEIPNLLLFTAHGLF